MQLHQVTWNIIKATTLQLRYLSYFACNATEECKHFSLQPPFFDTIKHRISEGTNVNITTNFLNSSDEIKVREWVAVIYDNSWYQGLVEKVNDKLEINFMNRSVKRFY